MPQHVAFAANPRERRNVTPAKRIGGRLKQALDLMVWGDGERRYLPDNEAAAKAGLNVLTIRLALQRPHVLAYYREQREVLRARESPANIHRLCEIRDAADNMPAVNAIRALEQIGGDEQTNRPNTPSPGISIRIVNVASPPGPIDIKSAPRIIDADE
jgi:hypothetical protein